MNIRLLRSVLLAALAFCGVLSGDHCVAHAQTASAQPAAAGPFPPLQFLEGAWEANTHGAQGVTSVGTYRFREELKGHILTRRGEAEAGCKGPAAFDCDHNDMLYIYVDAPGQPLKAIYFDNEGHTLHYAVTTPEPAMVVFLTDPAMPGPQFKLTYRLAGGVMSGKFQVKPPGAPDWTSYLEWSGSRVGK